MPGCPHKMKNKNACILFRKIWGIADGYSYRLSVIIYFDNLEICLLWHVCIGLLDLKNVKLYLYWFLRDVTIVKYTLLIKSGKPLSGKRFKRKHSEFHSVSNIKIIVIYKSDRFSRLNPATDGTAAKSQVTYLCTASIEFT